VTKEYPCSSIKPAMACPQRSTLCYKV